MGSSQQPSLVFKVTNVQLLASGVTPQIRFGVEGGTIGSGFSDDWRLIDNKGEIRASHCQVLIVDGAFCLKDISGETYMNGAFMPLGRGRLAKLQHKDEIQIGPYEIRLSMLTDSEAQIESTQLDKMFDSVGDDLLSNDFDDFSELEEEDVRNEDPLMALDALITERELNASILDSVAKPEETAQTGFIETYDEVCNGQVALITPPSDGEGQMTSSMSFKRILGLSGLKAKSVLKDVVQKTTAPKTTVSKTTIRPERISESTMTNNAKLTLTNNQSEGLGMDDNVLDLLEEEVAKSMESKPTAAPTKTRNNHLLTGPMLNGLGVDFLDHYDAAQMHSLSEELGESLQACIKGLLDLHQQVNSGRFGVMNRNLQPIEDNPLRLGLDYEETLKTMYDSSKSMVHLSAPSAISESLKNIRDHNDAVQQATTEALTQILAAFSPQVLMRRFNNYKRSNDGSAESDEAWAWKMYGSYYQELTSNRQKGFEKLFWEIFEQAYDKKIREKQLEF